MTKSGSAAARCAKAALRVVAIGAFGVILAGCYTSHDQVTNYPNDYRQRHPITLSDGQRTIEVFLARSRGGLSPAQRADVLAFAQAWRHEGTSVIVVEVPRGEKKNAVASDSLREIHSIFAASGVPQNGVRVRPYRPDNISLASIRISYGKLAAQAGPCGRWPFDLGPADDATHIENKPHWNFGCSTQRNLAAVVDDPADLVQPRGETPAYMARRSVAIDHYRKGENPSGTYNGFDTGKISDLGK